MKTETGNILPEGGVVKFYPDFFSKSESDILFDTLFKQVVWKQLPIKIFGREIMQPRLTAWFGDPDKSYTYSGLTLHANEWNVALREIKIKVEESSNTAFNSALLNLYRDGSDSMGWHRDNEKELGKDPVIASVSFGGTRKFQLRDYQTKKVKLSVELRHGSLLIMSGDTQEHWEHSVPKTKAPVNPRINITFRNVTGK